MCVTSGKVVYRRTQWIVYKAVLTTHVKHVMRYVKISVEKKLIFGFLLK